MQMGLAAAQQAVADAGLDPAKEDPYRVGCVVGSCIGGIETLLDQAAGFAQRGPRNVSPLLLPMVLPDSIAARIAIEYNLRGPNMSMSTACATSNNAIGEAVEMLRRGRADVIVAGGAECSILPVPVASMNNMTALSRRNDDPTKASRPFDRDRDGFVIAEGCGLLVLETEEHARARGARVLAELAGFGMSGDAYHISAPPEDGSGMVRVMRACLANAGLEPSDVDYVNAHGTSTPTGDVIEARAVRTVFGAHAGQLLVSSTKSATGHLLGAAGGLEAIVSVLAIARGVVPPTINLDNQDPAIDLDCVPHRAREHSVRAVLSNSFGFGGTNATLAFKRP
jgi:3-oxoacyl-[acyl-carrier-protein] synthase II